MRSIDLAIYADAIAAEAAAIAVRIERARGALRRAAIEHEARRALPAGTVSVLERRGVLGASVQVERDAEIARLADLQAELSALGRASDWVDAQLHAAQIAGTRAKG